MSRNPLYCPHNISEIDEITGEPYCVDCGIEVEDPDEEDDE